VTAFSDYDPSCDSSVWGFTENDWLAPCFSEARLLLAEVDFFEVLNMSSETFSQSDERVSFLDGASLEAATLCSCSDVCTCWV